MRALYYALRLALAWAVAVAIAMMFEGSLLALHLAHQVTPAGRPARAGHDGWGRIICR